jgi:hypothetical protein
MIRSVEFKNYKKYKDEKIDFGKINVLVGPNNSGKSSIISLFRLLQQTLKSYDNNIPMLLKGQNGDFGSYKNIVNCNNTKKKIQITIEYDNDVGSRVVARTETSEGKKGETVRYSWKYAYNSSTRTVGVESATINANGCTVDWYWNDANKSFNAETVNGIDISQFYTKEDSGNRPYHFLLHSSRNISKNVLECNVIKDNKIAKEIIEGAPAFLNSLYALLHGMEYIGAIRAHPERIFVFTGERHNSVGQYGERALGMLAHEAISAGSSIRLLEKTKNWMIKAGLASDIKFRSHGSMQELAVRPIGGNNIYQNYADVGYGISQIMPILVAGYSMRRGRLLICEQPEIHLHPKAQAELGDFFFDLYKFGAQTIIETHSEHLIVRLQQRNCN